MIAGWWRRRRAARTLQHRAIPDALWTLTLARYPFIARRSEADRQGLRELATLFLADKEFAGMQGLEVDDGMAVAIAAQACLPILRLGLAQYDAFKGIVVHPDIVVARREVMDEDGIVHHYDEELAGEAMEGGPVMLTWRDVADAGDSAEWGYNVVVHEFAHVLDMRDGPPDGMPPLPDATLRRRWRAVMDAALQRHADEVERDVPTWLDPYAAHGPEEFFPVASEAFFVAPDGLAAEFPAVYALLRDFYGQDPLKHHR